MDFNDLLDLNIKNECTPVFTDAGYNKLGKAPMYLGMVVGHPEGIPNSKVISRVVTSSTQAEYCALIFAMVYCLRIKEYDCYFMNDNQTMIRQLQGKYKVHNAELIRLHKLVNQLKLKFSTIHFVYINRKYNQADAIVRGLKRVRT
jgi:ribonuclease HI